MGKYIDFYCDDSHKKLKNISDMIIQKTFPWLPQKDYDEFYSIAGQTLWYCEEHYKESKDTQFETYLIGCLIRKFKTRVTYMNRKRRNNGNSDLSLDALIDDKDTAIMSMISTTDENMTNLYSSKMLKYLNRLSVLQKQILFDVADGYSNKEIVDKLGITDKEFSDAWTGLRAYRNVSILY